MSAERGQTRHMPVELAKALAASADAPPEERLKACDQLIQRALTDCARPALAELERLPACTTRVRRLLAAARFVDRAHAWLDFAGKRAAAGSWETLDGSAPGTASGPTGALLWLRRGAGKTVFAFSTRAGGFGPMTGWSSVFLVHRFLSELPVNVVYVRDETKCLSLAGNASFGADYSACVAGIRALCKARGWREVYGLGLSNGGYAALRYGLDLGFRAVLTFSGPSSLATAEERAQLHMEQLFRAAPGMAVDLVPLYERASRRPRMLLCYGERHPHDAVQARRMAIFPEAELIGFPDFDGHSTFMKAWHLGEVKPLAARLIEPAA